MQPIQREQILRINCPGYGQSSSFSVGQAKSLDNYRVLIVNPTSILHLFPKDSESLQSVETAQSEGLTCYKLDSDNLLKSLDEEVTTRTEELVQFLEDGGLLLFYLCRPFLLQGPRLSMDNYVWLLSLAPDQSPERNERHMSAVAHGRNIEPAETASQSEFFHYFSQPGLEWNTLIRTDFLTEGYSVLASAGAKKCIAGELFAGDNGGRIVFLPAPYSPDFDRTLIECLNFWHLKKAGFSPTMTEVSTLVGDLMLINKGEAPTKQKPQPQGEDLLILGGREGKSLEELSATAPSMPEKQLFSADSSSPTQKKSLLRPAQSTVGAHAAVLSEPKKPSMEETIAPAMAAPAKQTAASKNYSSEYSANNQAEAKAMPSFEGFPSPPTSVSSNAPGNGLNEEDSEITVPPPLSEDKDKLSDKLPSSAVSLKRSFAKVDQSSASPTLEIDSGRPQAANVSPIAMEFARLKEQLAKIPDWCRQFNIPGLEMLKDEQTLLAGQIKAAQTRLTQLDNQVNTLESLKDVLLSGEESVLLACCQTALSHLGWNVKGSQYGDHELLLTFEDTPEALCRVAHSAGQPQGSDLANLAKSMIAFWDQYEREPKGILVCATWSSQPVSERSEPDYTTSLVQFAEKKNICLISVVQLLTIYRDVELNKASATDIRKALLQTSGALEGFKLV